MNEQNKINFEPPVLTVLTDTFDQDVNTISGLNVWSIGKIEDINQ